MEKGNCNNKSPREEIQKKKITQEKNHKCEVSTRIKKNILIIILSKANWVKLCLYPKNENEALSTYI